MIIIVLLMMTFIASQYTPTFVLFEASDNDNNDDWWSGYLCSAHLMIIMMTFVVVVMMTRMLTPTVILMTCMVKHEHICSCFIYDVRPVWEHYDTVLVVLCRTSQLAHSDNLACKKFSKRPVSLKVCVCKFCHSLTVIFLLFNSVCI